MTKSVFVNWNDFKSIKKAERLKIKLENEGFNFLKAVILNLSECKLIYTKDA